MAIWNLYSKRNKAAQNAVQDVFIYDSLPRKVRVQIIHILADAFGDPRAFNSGTEAIWRELHRGLCREYGAFSLSATRCSDVEAVGNYFLDTNSLDEALDFVERAFIFVDTSCRTHYFKQWSEPRLDPDDAISELNERLLENAIGYEFVNGTVIRKDSEVMHKQVILPTLQLLANPAFKGANEEYRQAHEHYRHGRQKECLNECLKAFESTMKLICNQRGWAYSERDTAKQLIDIIFKNELVPSFLQSEFASLRTALESGIPTPRNRLSGHGQGERIVKVPDYFAEYLLGLTASTIRFLVNAAK